LLDELLYYSLTVFFFERKTLRQGSTLLPLNWTSYFTTALLFFFFLQKNTTAGLHSPAFKLDELLYYSLTVFVFLQKNTTAGLHSPAFKLDEEALPLGVALHATIGAVVKQ
jgi:metal-dependent amidase/aminoacylase/carboxypeptidase family protein